MNRIVFFVDGFNLYHALANEPRYNKFKWVDLTKLARCFVRRTDVIAAIYYFTALTSWSPDKMKRHKIFIRALQLKGVKVVYGEFRQKDHICRKCKGTYKTFEEKQTDVNIAIQLLQLAMHDEYDTAMIISGDSDLVPSIEAVQTLFPAKKVGVVIPIGRRAEVLKKVSDFHMKMKEKHLASSLFPEEIPIGQNEKLVCPLSWR